MEVTKLEEKYINHYGNCESINCKKCDAIYQYYTDCFKRANYKYQQSEKYKEYKRNYYKKRKLQLKKSNL